MNCRRNSYGGYSPSKHVPNDPGSLVTMLSHAPDDPACMGSCSGSSYDTLKASHCVSEHIEQSSKEKKTHTEPWGHILQRLLKRKKKGVTNMIRWGICVGGGSSRVCLGLNPGWPAWEKDEGPKNCLSSFSFLPGQAYEVYRCLVGDWV